MTRASSEDAQIAHGHPIQSGVDASPRSPDQVEQRWRRLRETLIRQLDMFQSGSLKLRSNHLDVSEAAIEDLRRGIREFDLLILGGA